MNALKFTLTLLLTSFFIHVAFAAPSTATVSSADIFDSTYSVDQVLTMNAKKYKALTGEKMKLKDRVALSMVKADVKIKMAKGDNLSQGIAMGQAMENFSIGGFLLGMFLGLLGVLISFFFKDKRVRRSAWKGLLVWFLILVVFGINLRG